jgi:hypothetical protein
MLPVETVIAYDNWAALSRWRRYGVVEAEDFTNEGVRVRGRLPEAMVQAVTGQESDQ